MKNESEVKTALVKAMRKQGGYGRRYEDQYAVGLPDTILIPASGPVFFAEVKIVRSKKFAPSVRQKVELDRIGKMNRECCIPVLLGYDPTTGFLYAGAAEETTVPGKAHVEDVMDVLELLLGYRAVYHRDYYNHV